MQELRILWSRIEKQVIYCVLFSFFVLQFLSIFNPQIATFMDARGSLMLIALVLLTMFRFLDERLTKREQTGLSASDGFIEEAVNLLRENRENQLVEIFASSGGLYYPAIFESKVRIHELKILLRDPNTPNDFKFPSDNEDREQLVLEINRIVRNLNRLKQKGQISKLSIRFYSFQPTFHCMIVNGRTLYFGLYKLLSSHSGTESKNTYVLRNNTTEGFRLLSDFKAAFENFWDTYATQNPV